MNNHKASKQASFDIAKGMNHLQNAITYFESTKVELNASYDVKNFFNECIKRMQWVQTQVMLKIRTDETRKAIKGEMEESGTIDSINNIVIALPGIMREEVEAFAQKLHDEFLAFKKEFGDLSQSEIEQELRKLAESAPDGMEKN